MDAQELHVIFGTGAVGLAIMDELLAKGGVYANLYKMTYEQEQAATAAAMVGEDEAVARRRAGELSTQPAAGA
jgi:hypothetical protein